jgi:Family of unknown function (DUF6169)
MSIATPYSFQQNSSEYRFDTENGIFYSLKFSNGSFYFVNLPTYIPIFEFSITIVSLGDNLSPPRDPRVEATIVSILRLFFLAYENSIVYICDNLDHKQAARHRKFDTWFRTHAEQDLEKYDTHFMVQSTEIYASLILHNLNHYKEDLIRIFLNQANEYNKD